MNENELLSNSQWLMPFSAKSVRQQGKPYYLTPTGDRIPSVTTILNATRPIAHREALAQWRQRLGAEQANQITQAASRRGTGTHKQVQRYLQGSSSNCSETVQPYWDSFWPVLQDISQVRLVEGLVFHDRLHYAGQVDCIASYQGVPCICEWKTADKPKETVERLYDYPLQLAAYYGAVNQFYQDLNLKHGLLVIAIPGMTAEVFWFGPEAMAGYWQQWEQRLTAFARRRVYAP